MAPVVVQGLAVPADPLVVVAATTTRILAPVDQVDLQVAVAMEIRILAPAEDNQEEGLDKGASIRRP